LSDADYLYACDQKWWNIHLEKIRKTFKGKLYTQFHNQDTRKWAEANDIIAIEGKTGPGLGQGFLRHGSNSGHQAINLAFHLAREQGIGDFKIFLLGYDMSGAGHWFGDHPKPLHQADKKSFINQYTEIAKELKIRGIECINMSRETKLNQFRKANLEELL